MPATLKIETAEVFAPLLDDARYKGAKGGRGSAKSWFFSELLVERCLMRHGTRWACVREIQRSLDQSVKRLLEDTIARLTLGHYFRVLNTHIETPGDGRISFVGMQNHTAESIKSLEGYDGAWVEEAQSLSQRSLDLLRPTIRKPHSEMWFSWNPRYPTDPVDVFFRDPPDHAVIIEANYADNPWFPAVLREEMEWDRGHDPEKYAHIWLGKYEQHAEARVFKNWRVETVDCQPVTTFLWGADWGFSIDPTVLVRCHVSGRTLYISREAYRVGCEIDHTPALFDLLENGQARHWVVMADSARPETISYHQRHGYPLMRQARKGPGSVDEGVAFLQNFDIVVDPQCVHTIDELTLYRYKSDPLTGLPIPQFEDAKNHVIDALRYAIEPLRLGTGAAFMHMPGF